MFRIIATAIIYQASQHTYYMVAISECHFARLLNNFGYFIRPIIELFSALLFIHNIAHTFFSLVNRSHDIIALPYFVLLLLLDFFFVISFGLSSYMETFLFLVCVLMATMRYFAWSLTGTCISNRHNTNLITALINFREINKRTKDHSFFFKKDCR